MQIEYFFFFKEFNDSYQTPSKALFPVYTNKKFYWLNDIFFFFLRKKEKDFIKLMLMLI